MLPINFRLCLQTLRLGFGFLELGILIDKGDKLPMRKGGKLNFRIMLIIYTSRLM